MSPTLRCRQAPCSRRGNSQQRAARQDHAGCAVGGAAVLRNARQLFEEVGRRKIKGRRETAAEPETYPAYCEGTLAAHQYQEAFEARWFSEEVLGGATVEDFNVCSFFGFYC